MKFTLPTLALLALAALAPSPASAWKQREFVTSFWWPPPPAETTNERYRQIRDAGFNLVLPGNGVANLAASHQMLDAATANRLRALVTDDRLAAGKAADMDAVVKEYGKSGALEGYLLQDEPGASRFTALADTVAALRRADSKRLAFINLLPTYASPEMWGAPTYEEYVQRYLDTVRPEVLCFDHYPFTSTGERPDYLENLEIIRRQALSHKVPFWTFVQAEGIEGAYRSPTEMEMRSQVFTALAYGAKGILYFTYWTPDPGGSEAHFDGILPRGGRPRARYDWVKRLNEEIGHLAPTLMQMKSLNVWQVDSKAKGTRPVATNDIFEAVEGGPATIGMFEVGRGKRFFWVVNRDTTKRVVVTIHLYRELVYRLFEHTLDGKTSLNLLHTDIKIPPKLDIALGAGEGRLFEVPELLR